MVCDWGMSDLGMVALGQSQSGGYLGHGAVTAKNYSEETAQKIDVIIRDMIQDQYNRALKIINDKRNALDVIAQSLLEHETIDGKHVLEIIEHGEMRSPIVKREISVEELEEDEERAKCLRNPPRKTMITAASLGKKRLHLLNFFVAPHTFSTGVKHGYIPLTWKRISLIS